MSEERYCAEVRQDGTVRRVIVCDDVVWARKELGGIWADCGTTNVAVDEPLPAQFSGAAAEAA